MIEVRYRTTGGLKFDPGPDGDFILLPDGARVRDLIDCLPGFGIDISSKKYIVTYNGRGLLQIPPDQPLQSGGLLLIFPPLMGG